MKWLKLRKCSSLNSKMKTYCGSTSIHGLRYLIDGEIHWAERLLWLLLSCLSFVGTYFLLVATYFNFVNNPISFVTDTAYLDWNTTFPAVSVCPSLTRNEVVSITNEMANSVLPKNWSTFENDKLDRLFIKEVFSCKAATSYCTSCAGACRYGGCPLDITPLLPEVEKQQSVACDKVLFNCSWNGIPFDCCTLFEPMETYHGTCFVINSMQTARYQKKPKKYRTLDLLSNRILGPGSLNFKFLKPGKVTIQSPEDVWTEAIQRDHSTVFNDVGDIHEWMLQISEIVNDPMLREVPIERRQCRFPDENPYNLYRYYSYSTCLVDCFIKEQMKLCGCTYHCMPGQGANSTDTCTSALGELGCIQKYRSHLDMPRKVTDENHRGVNCRYCLPSCNDAEYKIVRTRRLRTYELRRRNLTVNDFNDVTVRLAALPSHRYTRSVVRTKLDLVVALGGAAGLFLGASLLSLVELFYYCCIRGKPGDNLDEKHWKIIGDPVVAMTRVGKGQQVRRQELLVPGPKCLYPQDYACGPHM